MTKHPMIEFIAGDDWEIVATLLDENGNPYDLTQPHTIKWRLFNQNGPAINDSDVQINVTDAVNGIVSVLVPASVSTAVDGGLYSDALRLIIGQTGTLLMGPVNVVGDPWGVATRMEAHKDNRELRIVRQSA